MFVSNVDLLPLNLVQLGLQSAKLQRVEISCVEMVPDSEHIVFYGWNEQTAFALPRMYRSER